MLQKRFFVLSLLASAGVLAAPPTLDAQTDAISWRTALELGFTGSSGNSSFSILSAGGSLTRVDPVRYEFELSGRVRYGRSNSRVIANDLQVTAKYDWLPQSDWSPFVLVIGSRDRIRNLDLRWIGGGGAKWTFWRPGETTKMSLSLAAVVDRENFRLPSGSTVDETSTRYRWSWRYKFDHEFGSGAKLQHITFWQPEISGFGDYVVDVANSISTELISNLSLVVNHSLIYDAVPPPGAEKTDQRLAVVLRVSL